ncbi:MAG: hypothetical protein ABI921_02275 [Panacibacter sp.]
MPDSNILAFLFSTVAAIAATLTGLIGGFATFRLQRIDAKLDFLKDYILHKEVDNAGTLNTKIRGTGYRHIERIYLHNMEAVTLLQQLVEELDYHQHSEEYEHDINNISKHQLQYNKIKKLTRRDFTFSLCFVLLSIVLLLFTNAVLTNSFLWLVMIVFFLLMAAVFYKLAILVKNLIE